MIKLESPYEWQPENVCVCVCVSFLKHYLLNEKLEKSIQKNTLDSSVRNSYISERLQTIGNLQYLFTRYHVC